MTTQSNDEMAAAGGPTNKRKRARIRYWGLVARYQERTGKRLTVADIIEATQLPKNLVYRISRDELRELPLYAVPVLAEFFGVPFYELLEEVVDEGGDQPTGPRRKRDVGIERAGDEPDGAKPATEPSNEWGDIEL
jgi:hypothetical protein